MAWSVDTTAWVNVKNIWVSKRSQTINYIFCDAICTNSRISRTTVTKTKPMVSWGWRKGLTVKKRGGAFWVDAKFCILIVWWWLHDCIQLSRLSKYTLKVGHMLNVNYASIKLVMGERKIHMGEKLEENTMEFYQWLHFDGLCLCFLFSNYL